MTATPGRWAPISASRSAAASSTSPPNIATAKPTNRSAFDIRPNYNRPTAAFDARELTFDRLNFIYGDPDTEDWNFFVNSELPLGDVFDLYAFGSYGRRDGLSAANYRQSGSANNRDFSVLAPNEDPNAANFVPLRADGFLPFIASDLKDWSGTVGVKGEIAGWRSDFSLGYGKNKFDYETRNSLNTSFGPQSQSDFDAGGLRFAQTLANLDFSREFAVGLAGPLSVALGVEYRNENFQIRPGDTQSFAAGPFFRASVATTAADCATQSGVYAMATGICSFPGRQALVGAQGFPGFPTSSATDESRHSWSGYVELDAELAEGFTATAAGRYEHYSDFGDTVNGKLALRYEPIDGVALRGSISNGFRAPSLHQQYFTTTSTNFIAGFPVDISTVAVDSPVALALGRDPARARKVDQHERGRGAQPDARPDAHRRLLQYRDQRPDRADRESGRGGHRHRRRSATRSRRSSTPTASRAWARRASSSTASTPPPTASTSSPATASAPARWATGR